MAEVDRQVDLARIEMEERAVRLAAEKAAEVQRVADAEKAMQQARARMILDQKRDK